MKRLAFVLAATALLGPPLLAAAPPILPFDDVRPGMKGVGRTVFAGTAIEEFDVEILATLPDIGPDQNLILARCTGGPLASTRILSGMSGSPVYIDGRLVGAVAYSWGFSTEPIAGITPIEEMLRVGDRVGAPRAPAGPTTAGERTAVLDALRNPAAVARFFEGRGAALAAAVPAGARATIPVSVSGLSRAGFSVIAPWFRDIGLDPVQAPGGSRADTGPTTLEPGSAIGVKLIRGDVEMTATGTVTAVDGDRVLAFGHPLFGIGDVDLPMTTARVETLLPSLMQSSRLASATREVGVLRQDRAAAVAGRLGGAASMIPVRVQYADGAGTKHTFRFDVAEDPLLAPLLVYASLNGLLARHDRGFGDATIRIADGSVIKLEGVDDVALDNLFSGPEATAYATGTTAYILHLLLNNAWQPPRVLGVNLILEYDTAPRTARVRRVTLDRYRARAGDTVSVAVVLRPYRGDDLVIQRDVEVPAGTPAGPLNLIVGGSLAVSRPSPGQEPLVPADLEQFIWLVNNLRRNDHVFVLATREDDGLFMDGARLPNLPPAAASILTRPASRGNVTAVRERGIFEERVRTEFAVQGLARIQLQVDR